MLNSIRGKFDQICPGMQFSIRSPYIFLAAGGVQPPGKYRETNAKQHSRANLTKFARECSLAFAARISSWRLGGSSHQEDIGRANAKQHSRTNLTNVPGNAVWHSRPVYLPGSWVGPAHRKDT